MVRLQRLNSETAFINRFLMKVMLALTGLVLSCSGSTGLESSHLRSSERSSVDGNVDPVDPEISEQETVDEEQIDEELVAEPPVILSGSWLTCLKEVDGKKVSCEYHFDDMDTGGDQALTRGAVRFSINGADEQGNSRSMPEKELTIDAAMVYFDLPEGLDQLKDGASLSVEMVLERSKTSSIFRGDVNPLLAGEPMTLVEADRIELNPAPPAEPQTHTEVNKQEEQVPEDPVEVTDPKENETVLHVPDQELKEYTKLHVGDGNLGGIFAGFFNRDCSSGQKKNLTNIGTTLVLRFKVKSGSQFDELKIAEYCGVDVSATADLLDANGQIIESKSLNSSGDPREFKDLALGEGEYALRVTIGSFAGNPDDVFIHKILATYTGSVTFESPANK